MGNGNTFIYREISSYASLPSLNTNSEQSTEAINIKPALETAPGFQLSAEVSYFLVILSVGPPTLINWKPMTHIFSWQIDRLCGLCVFSQQVIVLPHDKRQRKNQ